MDPDGDRISLQNKVQFDIRFYFARRGRENMHTMQKSMFKVFFNQTTGHEYVAKVEDEATKNHRETDKPIETNFMPENKDDKMCPVRSFKMYMAHLHDENNYLWQTPNYKPKDPNSPVWYTKQHLGKNILGSFMSQLSKDAALSKIYTNHCIRVTGTSILSRCRYHDKEVMSITGNKSVQSLTVYQRVQDKKKMEMAKVLSSSMNKNDEALLQELENAHTPKAIPTTSNINPLAIEPPSDKIATVPQQNSTQVIPYEATFDEDIDDTDWLKLLCEVEENNPSVLPMPTVSNTLVQRNSPLFSNCKIGNINITINKK